MGQKVERFETFTIKNLGFSFVLTKEFILFATK